MTTSKILFQAILSAIFYPVGFLLWYINNKKEIESRISLVFLFCSIVTNTIAFDLLVVAPLGASRFNSILLGNALTLAFLGSRFIRRVFSKSWWIFYYIYSFLVHIFNIVFLGVLYFIFFRVFDRSFFLLIFPSVIGMIAWVFFTIKNPPKLLKENWA